MIGQYAPFNGGTICFDCPAGYAGDDGDDDGDDGDDGDDRSRCSRCLAGRHRGRADSKSICLGCDEGFYQ
jgi:hypothetical protein